MADSINQTIHKGEIATRDRAYSYYMLGMFLPNPDPVLKAMNKDITIYKEMTTDAHVWSQIQKRKNGVLTREWFLDRDTAPSRQFKVLDTHFKDELDVDRINANVLDAVLYGYQPMEIIWGKYGPWMLPMDIKAKPADWFCFSERNELLFRTKTKWDGEPVKPRHFLCPQYYATYENPYGEPTLARCFWPLTFKKGGMRFWSTFLEKYGMMIPIGKLPRNRPQEDYDDMKERLEEMVQDALAVIPDDGSIDFANTSGKSDSTQSYKTMLDMCNAEMSKAIIGSTLTTEIGDTGSYAAAETHADGNNDFYVADSKIIRTFWANVIRLIYDVNWSGAMPRFKLYEEDDAKKNLAERDQILKNALNVKFNDNYIEDTYGINKKYFEINKEPETGNRRTENGKPDVPTADSGLSRGLDVPTADIDNKDNTNEKDTEFAAADIAAILDKTPAAEWQAMAEGVLKPVIEEIDKGTSFNILMKNIATAYPSMDTSAMFSMIHRARFVSQVVGYLEAMEEME